MNIETAWMNITPEQKLWIMIDCGWFVGTTHKPSSTARKASKQSWNELTPAIKNVLIRKAQEGKINL